jgi:ABC-type antimicrobial peptide transport system permease subunit
VVRSPSARGWSWDVNVGNFSNREESAAGKRALERDPDVESFTGYDVEEQIPIDGKQVDLMGLEDPAVVAVPVSSGRLPSAPGEIVLTRVTSDELGRHVGDSVSVVGFHGARRTFRVVGISVGPGAVENDMDLAKGAIARWDDLRRLAPPTVTLNGYAVRFRDGVDRAAAVHRLRSTFGLAIFESSPTNGIASMERVQPLLALFAGTVLVLAAGTLVHALAVALRRRRREVALLKALGFDRGAVGRTVVLQAVSLASLSVVVGVPVGLVVGRVAWRGVARTIGVLSGPITPISVVLAAVLVIAVAAMSSLSAARRARSVAVADILRTE